MRGSLPSPLPSREHVYDARPDFSFQPLSGSGNARLTGHFRFQPADADGAFQRKRESWYFHDACLVMSETFLRPCGFGVWL